MANRFLPIAYLMVFATLVSLVFAIAATGFQTGVIGKAYEAFGVRAYGIDPKLDTVEVVPEELKIAWKPVEQEVRTEQVTWFPAEDLYPPQAANAPLPNQSLRSNDLVQNIFYALMYYGHPPAEYDGLTLTFEYDRATGYGRVVQDLMEEVYTDIFSYLAALELHHVLYPEVALFNEERLKMRTLARRLLETVPASESILASPRAMNDAPYWLTRQLAQLTGEAWFDEFADRYGELFHRQGIFYADLVASERPYTLYPSHFMLPAVMHDIGQRRGSPELQRKAGELMRALTERLYDPRTKTIFSDYGTLSGPGSDTRQAMDLFDALTGLWRYVRLTNDSAARRLAETLSATLTLADPASRNPLLSTSIDIYRLYATQNEQGTYLLGDRISGLLNLRHVDAIQKFNALTGFGSYDQEFAVLLQLYRDRFYDENYNGFYAEYMYDTSRQRYDPVAPTGTYFLNTRVAARLAYLILNDQGERALALAGAARMQPPPETPALSTDEPAGADG